MSPDARRVLVTVALVAVAVAFVCCGIAVVLATIGDGLMRRTP